VHALRHSPGTVFKLNDPVAALNYGRFSGYICHRLGMQPGRTRIVSHQMLPITYWRVVLTLCYASLESTRWITTVLMHTRRITAGLRRQLGLIL
jgi:hypothetical protein